MSAPADRHGLDFSVLRAYARNQVQVPRVDPQAFLGPPVPAAAIDLVELAQNEVRASVTLPIERDGTVHGVAGWFDAELAEGVRLGNPPPALGSSWAHVLFPM